MEALTVGAWCEEGSARRTVQSLGLARSSRGRRASCTAGRRHGSAAEGLARGLRVSSAGSLSATAPRNFDSKSSGAAPKMKSPRRGFSGVEHRECPCELDCTDSTAGATVRGPRRNGRSCDARRRSASNSASPISDRSRSDASVASASGTCSSLSSFSTRSRTACRTSTRKASRSCCVFMPGRAHS